MLYKVTHWTGHVLANTRPHQLCSGVTGRWGLLSHVQNAVRWLALSNWSVEACLLGQTSYVYFKLISQQKSNRCNVHTNAIFTELSMNILFKLENSFHGYIQWFWCHCSSHQQVSTRILQRKRCVAMAT